MTAQEFIKQHKHINYCETIISPEGDIRYAIGGHARAMYEVMTGKSFVEAKDEVMEKVPVEANPVLWCMEATGYVITWYENALFPINFTEEQVNAVTEMMRAGVLGRFPDGVGIINEKSVVEVNRRGNKEEIEETYQNKIMTLQDLRYLIEEKLYAEEGEEDNEKR